MTDSKKIMPDKRNEEVPDEITSPSGSQFSPKSEPTEEELREILTRRLRQLGYL